MAKVYFGNAELSGNLSNSSVIFPFTPRLLLTGNISFSSNKTKYDPIYYVGLIGGSGLWFTTNQTVDTNLVYTESTKTLTNTSNVLIFYTAIQ